MNYYVIYGNKGSDLFVKTFNFEREACDFIEKAVTRSASVVSDFTVVHGEPVVVSVEYKITFSHTRG